MRQICTWVLLTLCTVRTGGAASRTTAGRSAGNRVSADGLSLHQVCTEAGFFSVKLGTKLHQCDRVEVLRYKRVCDGQANEDSRGRGRNVDLHVVWRFGRTVTSMFEPNSLRFFSCTSTRDIQVSDLSAIHCFAHRVGMFVSYSTRANG